MTTCPAADRRSRAIVLALAALTLLACGASSETEDTGAREITAAATAIAEPPCRAATEAELAAIATAEAFVRDNGYTDAPVPDGVEVVFEPIEPGADRASRLAFRRGMLEPSAYGVFPPRDGAPITVVFRYQRAALLRTFSPADADERLARTARAVVVGGTEPAHIVHQDASLSFAQRVCPR